MRNSPSGVNLSDPVYATNDGPITTISPGSKNVASFISQQVGKNQLAISAHTTACCGVAVGSFVYAGQQIGWTDLTGFSSGFHVHFRVMFHGRSVDPNVYFGPTLTPGD
jgi:murein DD-endopeptidase MepM/ murein hydrolase activator NlpD